MPKKNSTIKKKRSVPRKPEKPRARIIPIIGTVTNEETPKELFDVVADFVVTAAGGNLKRFWTVPMLEHLLEWYEEKNQEAANVN
ncbi:MAG TPA: hypothetical protein VJ180_00605 [Pyrinomonadaceae bacterium]|nr:hypothetical protein [Pyrinomonadaceae bacterium]